ncbi:hypothetical protein V2J52_05185 [Georgenia sp. MJ173]|uniref:hypothetical protein n=1 Tax=Georgenia sunbinii TaxID=3117728 RepID=UPI002F26CEFF
MSRKQKFSEIDAEKVRRQAAELGHVIGEQAGKAGEAAASLAEQGKVWATDVAAPKLDKAWRDGVKATAPKIEAAAEKARPAVDTARDKLVEDYIPRLQQAMHDAAAAAAGEDNIKDRAGKAGKAAKKALTKPTKSHRGAKTVGWILVGTAAAGTGYLLWRRTQPVEDPWAEEYWEDATSAPEVSTVPPVADAEPAADIAEVVADADAEAAEQAAESPVDLGRGGETATDKTKK